LKRVAILAPLMTVSLFLTCRCSGNAETSPSAGTSTTEQRGSSSTPQAGGAPGKKAAGVSDSVKGGLPAGLTLPLVLAGSVYESRSMVAEAVYYATAASGAAQFGRIMTTGTVLVSAAGTQYAPGPADRLVVRLGDQTHEFVLKQAQGGNQAPTASGWLAAPHILQYTHKIPDTAEAEVAEQFDGVRFTSRVTGWAKLNAQRFDIDLSAAGQTAGDRDFNGQDIQTAYDLTGMLRGNGCEITVNQRQRIRTVGAYSLNLLYSQRGTATQLDAAINSAVQCEGETYTFNNVQVQSGSTDKGGNSRSAVSAATGTITRGGQAFATVSLQNGAVVAATANGPVIIGGR